MNAKPTNKTYMLESRGAKAIGRFAGNGEAFTVLAGAKVSNDETEEFATCDRFGKRLRDTLINTNVIQGGKLMCDYTFSTCSCAASVLTGMQSQGPAVWKEYP